MELKELALWAGSFAAYGARFDDLCERSESRGQAHQYLRSLLAPVERKTRWQLAEVAHDATPDRRQRLRYRVAWAAEAARARLQQCVIERFGDPEGIGVLVDETGVPKKGTRSVGVAKQSCGALGTLENCQVATLLTYATADGPVVLERQLFLPAAWCWARARRARAQVPEGGTFQPKPQPAPASPSQPQPAPASPSKPQPAPASPSQPQPAPASPSQPQPAPASPSHAGARLEAGGAAALGDGR
jgi:SRSO17 transposase